MLPQAVPYQLVCPTHILSYEAKPFLAAIQLGKESCECWERGRPVRHRTCKYCWIDKSSYMALNPQAVEGRMNSIKAKLRRDLQEAGWRSRGYLPHFEGGEIAQSINLRLADSLPKRVLERWNQELTRDRTLAAPIVRERTERYLDQGYGSCALRDECVAQMVQDALLHFDGERYWLSAWVVMPNHVYLLLTPNSLWSLSRIMKFFKSYTSHEANRILGRQGQFWMEDYFDRYIRDHKHFTNAITYIENNPVKAGLCATAGDWVFSSAWFREQHESGLEFALAKRGRTRRPRSQH